MKTRKLVLLFAALFILAGVNCYSEEETARQKLSKAIKDGNLTEVQSLIESQAVGLEELPKYDSFGITPLVEASGYAHVPIMKYLIEKGASINGVAAKKSTPLTKFIEGGGLKLSCSELKETIQFLLSKGADINFAGVNGYTPLMRVCQFTRCIDLINEFISLGALIDVQSSDENTAFLLCIRNTNVNGFRLLLKHGANTTLYCKGLSPLGVAASIGNLSMAKIVIDELHVDVNAYDPVGGTPIIWAAMNGHDAMVTFLAQMGANINAMTREEIRVVKPHEGFIAPMSKTYYVFPSTSTPLTFAKFFKHYSTINTIADLGGIAPTHLVVNEEVEPTFRYLR